MALGLIINNAAVVIGGMIIAPLLWPILALALAVIKGNGRLFIFLLFLKASFIIFLVSFVIGVFSPFLGDSHEVLLRTQPTLFELFIALAAGFVGAFAIAYTKLSATGKSKAASNISWFVIFLIIVAAPLTLVTRNIIKENGERNIIRDVISEYTVGTKITDLSVNDIGKVVVINATLRSS